MRANLLQAGLLLAAASLVAGCVDSPTSTGDLPREEINWPDIPIDLAQVRIVVDGLSPTATTGGDIQVWPIYPPPDGGISYTISVPRTGVAQFVIMLEGAVKYRPPPDHALAPGEVDTKEIKFAPPDTSGVREVRFVVVVAGP